MTMTNSVDSIDIATRGAEQFINVYYEIYDSKERDQRLPNFYRNSSTVVWNGNPKQGAGIRQDRDGGGLRHREPCARSSGASCN